MTQFPSVKLTLTNLLAPIEIEQFLNTYWEKKLLHATGNESERYNSLLTDLEKLITSAIDLEDSCVEVLNDPAGNDGPPQRVAQSAVDAHAAYERGATIRVNGVQRLGGPLQELCSQLEQFFGFPVAANLYHTPPLSRGTPRHYDNHDVMVLQVRGRKRWRIYEPIVALPLKYVPPLSFEERDEELQYHRGGPRKGRAEVQDDECGVPLSELELSSGDLLYLPRGFIHEAQATEGDSLHLTIGIRVLTWLDLLAVSLGQLGQKDERFRKALPVGLLTEIEMTDAAKQQFNELLNAFSGRASLLDGAVEVTESFVRSRKDNGNEDPTVDLETGEIDAQTLLERRPSLLCRLVMGSETVGLVSSQNAVWMPKIFYPALHFVAEMFRFCPAEIPGSMSEHSKLVLARKLIRDGFLRVAQDQESG